MWVHFFHRYVQGVVSILEEGDLPHPWLPRCDILVPWRALIRWHLTTAQCDKGVERKRQCMEEEDMRESEKRAF